MARDRGPDIGDLVSLITLDTRAEGRDQQLDLGSAAKAGGAVADGEEVSAAVRKSKDRKPRGKAGGKKGKAAADDEEEKDGEEEDAIVMFGSLSSTRKTCACGS